jgi:U3 small nucleolar ribonucleoprotein protein IMP3
LHLLCESTSLFLPFFAVGLPVILIRSKMCENLRTTTQLIEQGHVRDGPDVIKDPAFIVTRNMEDFVTWVDTSAIRKRILEYKEMRDDFDIYC